MHIEHLQMNRNFNFTSNNQYFSINFKRVTSRKNIKTFSSLLPGVLACNCLKPDFIYNENYIRNQEWLKHSYSYINESKDKDIYDTCLKGKTKYQQKHNLKLIKKLETSIPGNSIYKSFFDPINQYLKPGILTDDNGIINETLTQNFIDEAERRKKRIKIFEQQAFEETIKYAEVDKRKELPAIVLAAAKNDDGTISNEFIDSANIIMQLLEITAIEKNADKNSLPTKNFNHYFNYEKVMLQILKEIKENTIKTCGKIDENYMNSLVEKLKIELNSYAIISDSKTLESILSTELKQKLGFKIGLKDLSAEEILQQTDNNYAKYKTFPEHIELLTYILHNNPSIDDLYSFLYHVTADEKLGIKLVKELQTEPTKGNSLKNYILKKLGGDTDGISLYNKWYNDEQYGYKKAYTGFYNEFFNNSKDLMTLVKQSPNIAPWAFVTKAKELGIEPTLGKLPKSFGSLEEFRILIDEISKFNKDYGLKYSKPKYIDIRNSEYFITINNKRFKIEPIKSGESTKTKYKVTPNDSNKSYIIKFNEYDAIGNTRRSKQFRENQAMKGDSPYLNALIDFYLKENNCSNVADVQFYDYKSKCIVYEMIQGEQADFEEDALKNLHTFNNSKLTENISSLGIILNDVKNENFIKDQNGRLILIDSGHAEYNHPFRPMIPGKHISLSNLCGRAT